MDSNRPDDLEPTEVIEAPPGGFASDSLERHVGFVADIELVDGVQLSGVIVAVSPTSLIVEGWDSAIHATNGDLSTVAIDLVRRLSLP